MPQKTAVLERPSIRKWLPEHTPRGAFLFLHGMESHSGWFDEIALRLAGKGWAVLAGDRPGWGRSEGPRGHLESYRDFVEETAESAVSIREHFGCLHLAGMSWGGMAALYLCLRRGWLFDSVSLMAPGLFTKIALSSFGALQVAAEFVHPNRSRQVEPLFQPEHFTKNAGWREYIAKDPDRLRRVGASFCLETIKMRRFINEMAGRRQLPPAQCLLAGDDAIVDNRRTEELCRRAGMEVKTLIGAAHSLVFERPRETAEHLVNHAVSVGDRRFRERKRVWVVGGGAVGGALASLLTFGGQETGLLVKPSQVEALREKKLTLKSGSAARRTGKELLIAARPEELPAEPDMVILAVKSFDTPTALTGLRGKIPGAAILTSLQNGVGNEDAIEAAFPGHDVAAAVICASLESPELGEIKWADDRGGVGAACRRGNGEKARDVYGNVFSATGMECLWVDGERASSRLKWSKLMLNIGFNALNALTGKSSVELLADAGTGRLAVRAMREGFAVMRTLSLKPVNLPGFPVSAMEFVVRLPIDLARRILAWRAGGSAETAFSMRQDILKKRQHTEIHELNGEAVRIGREMNLNMSANAKLVKMLEDFLESS
ncbi:MAG: 2-dehydropantoate 2-reductase [Planctomycetes bacterium]|nr:2-dehydropantoate 2-reductase [Planctomycetota bacterium]